MMSRKQKNNLFAIINIVLKIFFEYRWPGNIRELKHTLEHACLLCMEKIIRVEHLPLELQKPLSLKTNKKSEYSSEAERITRMFKGQQEQYELILK